MILLIKVTNVWHLMKKYLSRHVIFDELSFPFAKPVAISHDTLPSNSEFLPKIPISIPKADSRSYT